METAEMEMIRMGIQILGVLVLVLVVEMGMD
jgi:hypothetical protein